MTQAELPRRIGPYRVIGRLGRGGMADVLLAVAYGASGFEKRVALKVLHEELGGEADVVRALIEEAKLGARLGHRNLVGVHDLGVDGGRYWVRMDWVDGADLATLVRRQSMPPALALHAVIEIAAGLAYLHRATDDAGRPLGLTHRDVCPSNVLVSRSGEVKLADLGIAKATLRADVTRGGVRKGTYAYMSPEQVAGEALSPASDLFSLGVVVYELLVGRRPFDSPAGAAKDEGPHALMARIRAAEPPDFSSLPEDLRGILAVCLRRDPRDRFASAEALGRALGSARTGCPESGPADLGRWVAQAVPTTP